MAVLAVLVPPLMLGLLLALGRYEELLLPERTTDRPAPAVAPNEPVPAGTPPSRDRFPSARSGHFGCQVVARRHPVEERRCLDDATETAHRTG
jgi:hypothetical protein